MVTVREEMSPNRGQESCLQGSRVVCSGKEMTVGQGDRKRRSEGCHQGQPPCSAFVGLCSHLGNVTGLWGAAGEEDLVHVKSHSSGNKFILWLASVFLKWVCNLTAVYKGSVRGLLCANSQLLSS